MNHAMKPVSLIPKTVGDGTPLAERREDPEHLELEGHHGRLIDGGDDVLGARLGFADRELPQR